MTDKWDDIDWGRLETAAVSTRQIRQPPPRPRIKTPYSPLHTPAQRPGPKRRGYTRAPPEQVGPAPAAPTGPVAGQRLVSRPGVSAKFSQQIAEQAAPLLGALERCEYGAFRSQVNQLWGRRPDTAPTAPTDRTGSRSREQFYRWWAHFHDFRQVAQNHSLRKIGHYLKTTEYRSRCRLLTNRPKGFHPPPPNFREGWMHDTAAMIRDEPDVSQLIPKLSSAIEQRKQYEDSLPGDARVPFDLRERCFDQLVDGEAQTLVHLLIMTHPLGEIIDLLERLVPLYDASYTMLPGGNFSMVLSMMNSRRRTPLDLALEHLRVDPAFIHDAMGSMTGIDLQALDRLIELGCPVNLLTPSSVETGKQPIAWLSPLMRVEADKGALLFGGDPVIKRAVINMLTLLGGRKISRNEV
jgi:hypothetical protein